MLEDIERMRTQKSCLLVGFHRLFKPAIYLLSARLLLMVAQELFLEVSAPEATLLEQKLVDR
jgi:hypothetical protein